jgi:hypothetical protein
MIRASRTIAPWRLHALCCPGNAGQPHGAGEESQMLWTLRSLELTESLCLDHIRLNWMSASWDDEYLTVKEIADRLKLNQQPCVTG